MKSIGEILAVLGEGEGENGLQHNLQRAQLMTDIERTIRRFLSDQGFDEVVCRPHTLEDGKLHVVSPAAADVVRLKQMASSLRSAVQREFPDIKYLDFRVQP